MCYDFIENIVEENTVLRVRLSGHLQLSAAVWTDNSRGRIPKARFDCLQKATHKVSICLPGYIFWLLSGHGPLQTNTKIVRYNGYWKSLRARGVKFPEGEAFEEQVKDYDGGLRFFGAIPFSLSQLMEANDVLTAERSAFIAAIPKESRHAISESITQGWVLTNANPPEEILYSISATGGVVFGVYGSFDDPDVSVAVFGRKEVIQRLND